MELIAVPAVLIAVVWVICAGLNSRDRRHRELLEALRDKE